MSKATQIPVIQLITRERNANIYGHSIWRKGGVDELIENVYLLELREGKNGYLKISQTEERIFFDTNLEPVKDYEIYKVTHVAENNRAYRNFIEQDESKLLRWMEEKNISVMTFPFINKSATNIGKNIINIFKKFNFKKFSDWTFEKVVRGKSLPLKLSKLAQEVFGFTDKKARESLEAKPEEKIFEAPSEFFTNPLQYMGLSEWNLTIFSYRMLKKFHTLFYVDKNYKGFNEFEKISEGSFDWIKINNKTAVRVYGHNGLYLYQLYWDVMHGDFCQRCGRFLETPLRTNGIIRQNRNKKEALASICLRWLPG